jgi:regulator of protease activity HflC (stomatin/prohibitin superfamily)
MKVIVEAYQKGLKFRNGRFVGTLGPGRYRVWRFLVKERIDRVDLREQLLEVAGQEMMTADKVTLRLNVVARYKVVDPVAATLKVANLYGQLYADVQLAIREAVSARTLDDLIAEKATLGDKVIEGLKLSAAGYGVELLELGIKDVVLPGDLKAQFVRVLEARKRAEAAQIERREEVAATRSLANTAALLEKNPTLYRLKVLEGLEKIARTGTKIVLPADFLRDERKEA